MRVTILILLCSLHAFPQTGIDLGNEALDDPDENQYLEQLLATLFQRVILETADSSVLEARGYSQQAIALILNWQQQKGRKGSRNWLSKQFEDEDLMLLTQDLKNEAESTQIQLRQRIQYSPGLAGWRILNKGRLWNQWGSVNILTEQDPGESQLTDHSIVTVNSFSVPHFDNIILGDFHVKWGGGLILNQQGTRLSLNPKSLLHKNLLAMRPHYSSRETDYYQGLATCFSIKNIQGAAFFSDREMKGLGIRHEFKEDADGIHPAGKWFDTNRTKSLGLALKTHVLKIQLYGSALFNPAVNPGLVYELGFSRSLSVSHQIQVFTNSLSVRAHRLLLAWSYSTKPLNLSAQYRRYHTDSLSPSGSLSTLLGSSALNEEGFSVRAQIKPTKKVQIRYALETGNSVELQSYCNYRTIQHHKVQFVRKLNGGVCQIDFSRKREQALWEGDIWNGHITQRTISKGAVSLLHHFSSDLKYRVNLKSAYMGKASALLVQQRIYGSRGNWKWTLGYVRYAVPDYTLRLSIYETSVAESFSFYTCYDDGDRWFLYVKQQAREWFNLELRLVQTHSFDDLIAPKQLALSFQMSVVL